MQSGLSKISSLLLLGSAVVCAQPEVPRPSPSLTVDSGSSSLAGHVRDRNTRQPIEGALITLSSVDRRRSLVSLTDAAGEYRFIAIAPGDYRVTASHVDYVTTEYGLPEGRRAERTDVGTVRVEHETTRSGVDFSLARASTIRGAVKRDDGRPLANANVMAIPPMDDGGLSSRPPNSSARTNQRGEYVLSGLAEGWYQISATWSEPSEPKSRPLVVHYPGVVVHPGRGPQQDRAHVQVTAGRTLNGVDLVVSASELLRVSGTLVYSGAGLLDAFLTSDDGALPVEIAADGSFTTGRLRTGRYTLVARARHAGSLEAAALPIELFTSDLDNVLVGLMPTGTISGRVITADGTSVPDELQVAAVLVSSDGIELEEYGSGRGRDRAVIDSNGAFQIRDVFGERVLRIVGVTAGWKIARVTIGRSDVTTLSIQPGVAIEDVLIVLTRS